jgi:glutathione S-transferase
MLRYVGRKAGIYPDDDLQALFCDETMDAVEDLLHQIVRTFGMEGDELKAARKELRDGWLTIFLKGLSDILERGGGEYFADRRLTVADLKVFVQIRSLRSGNLDHIPSDFVDTLTPNLAAHEKRIAAHPLVVDYYERFKAAS